MPRPQVVIHPSPTKGLVAEDVDQVQQLTIENHPQFGKQKEVIDSVAGSGKMMSEAICGESSGKMANVPRPNGDQQKGDVCNVVEHL